jgi:hypothetical protein
MARSTFPFSQPLAGITGVRHEVVLTGETEEARMKADQTTVMFGHGGGQVVISDLTRDAAQFGERMNVTANEGFEALAMSELDIQRAAVRIDEGEGIQLARIARVIERAEVAPVNLEAFPGNGFHADERPAGHDFRADVPHVLSEDAVTAVVSQGAEILLDDRGGDGRVLLDPFRDSSFERVEFAKAVPMGGVLRGCIKILPDSFPADAELPLDLADGPVLGPVQPVQVVDLFGAQHGAFSSVMRQDRRLRQHVVVCKMAPAA